MKFTTFTALAIAFASIGAFDSSARAEIIHFTNPAPGQLGHYQWNTWLGLPDSRPRWLDITLPAASQPNMESAYAVAQYWAVDLGSWWGAMYGGATFAVNSSSGLPAALMFGEPLSGLSYTANDVELAGGAPGTINSPFPEGVVRYVGVVTQGGRYGWIEVTREGFNLTAHAWAYETEPGVPIYAGQIPAPGPLALLAIGACTSPSRSRRRRA